MPTRSGPGPSFATSRTQSAPDRTERSHNPVAGSRLSSCLPQGCSGARAFDWRAGNRIVYDLCVLGEIRDERASIARRGTGPVRAVRAYGDLPRVLSGQRPGRAGGRVTRRIFGGTQGSAIPACRRVRLRLRGVIPSAGVPVSVVVALRCRARSVPCTCQSCGGRSTGGGRWGVSGARDRSVLRMRRLHQRILIRGGI
jgi:hypothetical protein